MKALNKFATKSAHITIPKRDAPTLNVTKNPPTIPKPQDQPQTTP